jgi:hypothetical protein
MKKLILGLLICMACQLTLTGQTIEKEPRNAIHMEALGHGVLYSLNYERLLITGKRFQTTAQLGIGYYGKKSGIVPLVIPLTINEQFALTEKHFLEAGVGRVFTDDGEVNVEGVHESVYTFDDWIFRLGYRYHSPNDKWVFRVSYTPFLFIWRPETGGAFFDYENWAGLSFGYRF